MADQEVDTTESILNDKDHEELADLLLHALLYETDQNVISETIERLGANESRLDKSKLHQLMFVRLQGLFTNSSAQGGVLSFQQLMGRVSIFAAIIESMAAASTSDPALDEVDQ